MKIDKITINDAVGMCVGLYMDGKFPIDDDNVALVPSFLETLFTGEDLYRYSYGLKDGTISVTFSEGNLRLIYTATIGDDRRLSGETLESAINNESNIVFEWNKDTLSVIDRWESLKNDMENILKQHDRLLEYSIMHYLNNNNIESEFFNKTYTALVDGVKYETIVVDDIPEMITLVSKLTSMVTDDNRDTISNAIKSLLKTHGVNDVDITNGDIILHHNNSLSMNNPLSVTRYGVHPICTRDIELIYNTIVPALLLYLSDQISDNIFILTRLRYIDDDILATLERLSIYKNILIF